MFGFAIAWSVWISSEITKIKIYHFLIRGEFGTEPALDFTSWSMDA
jgi:hypothetical protein